MTDVAVIGAGMAGLVCAQQLKQAGYSVLVVEKSRGLGDESQHAVYLILVRITGLVTSSQKVNF